MSCSGSETVSLGSSDHIYEIETEDVRADGFREDDNTFFEPYADEPLADEEWTANYEEERREEDEKYRLFAKRLNKEVPVVSWCKCGLCEVGLLVNPMECYCCHEIEECGLALEEKLVLDEMGSKPKCVTLHPGFRPCCLEPWSLRLAGSRYRTRDKTEYKKKTTEEAYLRAIAYREFTRLIHGILGKRRIPLPACVYNTIRGKFKTDEELVGFLDED